ncbi:MAG: glycosyltransferase family 4 protein [Myxococcales bacterium]|nr:glycosyltransferase family 4 protein [Myxococcales bacterium]
MSQPLRVCLVVPGFSTDTADNCIPALRAWATALGGRHDVTVVSLRFPHSDTPYTLGPLRVIPLGGADISGAGRLSLLARAVATVVRAGPFDVVQGLWADEPGMVAVLAGRALGARTIVSLMGGELARLPAVPYGGRLEGLGPWLVQSALRHADHVTVGSPWLADRVPERWRAKTTQMPLPLPDRVIQSQSQRPKPQGDDAPLRVGLVASLLPVKAPGLLLSAAATAGHRGTRLQVTVVGDGPLRARLTRQAQRLGVDARFVGAVPYQRLTSMAAKWDVIAQTSWWESQGMAVLEAAAVGCAVVGTDVGAAADLEHALAKVPPGDVQGLAAALCDAANHRKKTRKSGKKAANEIAVHYAMDACLSRWQALVS